MAVQAVQNNAVPNPSQDAKPPQPIAQEAAKPRPQDRVDFSGEAQRQAKAEAAQREEQQRAEATQQAAAQQARTQENRKTDAAQAQNRVDVTA